MNRIRDFLSKNSGVVLMAIGTFIVALAEKSTTLSMWVWHYEPEMPKCLIEES